MEKTQEYWEFTQNNSGGSFVENEELCHRLFIEADNEAKAIEIAIEMGVYFDGASDGSDCSCCGDRWSSPDKIVFPYNYGAFSKAEANKIAGKYNATVVPTEFRFMGTEEPDPTKFDVVFADVEDHAQYLADQYGWGGVDARIFYANGRIKEIKKTI